MKISNSKKELARIISENGGWRDGAEFTAQDGDGTGSIDFFKSKPRYGKSDKFWRGEYDLGERIKYADVTIKNFHQTILSREEYFHLYQAPNADGWIEWEGGKCPVDRGTLLDVKFEDGMVMLGAPAGTTGDEFERHLIDWSGDVCDGTRIAAYRLHKPEQYIGELCDKVTEENKHEHVDCKPTIEQLAADYRNRKDYAYRKQAEADAAKADADAKLDELVAAGKVIGLMVSVADTEPELVITDWRDLKVGDIVKVVGSDNLHWKRLAGVELRITGVGNSESDLVFAPSDGEDWSNGGNTQWKFIRRP